MQCKNILERGEFFDEFSTVEAFEVVDECRCLGVESREFLVAKPLPVLAPCARVAAW